MEKTLTQKFNELKEELQISLEKFEDKLELQKEEPKNEFIFTKQEFMNFINLFEENIHDKFSEGIEDIEVDERDIVTLDLNGNEIEVFIDQDFVKNEFKNALPMMGIEFDEVLKLVSQVKQK